MLYAVLPEPEWQDVDSGFDQMKKLAEHYLRASIWLY
jgi:hypothetical protein